MIERKQFKACEKKLENEGVRRELLKTRRVFDAWKENKEEEKMRGVTEELEAEIPIRESKEAEAEMVTDFNINESKKRALTLFSDLSMRFIKE